MIVVMARADDFQAARMEFLGEILDFATKQVRMSFTTDNPNGLKLPLINDLIRGARQELLQINIRGTIQA